MNLNAVDKMFLRDVSVHFTRRDKGSRIVTVCSLKIDSGCGGWSELGVGILNPEDVDNLTDGAWESFNDAIRNIKSSYMRTLLREWMEENISKIVWWAGDKEGTVVVW